METTARQYLTAIRQAEVNLNLYSLAVFINHDQLNLSVFPAELLAGKPLLIFVESFAYATHIPHHKQKLVYILSAQRHFAIACYEQGYPVYTVFTLGYHADGVREILTQYPQLRTIAMQPSEWDSRWRLEKLRQEMGDRLTIIANGFFMANLEEFQHKIKKNYRLETFYRAMRKATGYLMREGKPEGGKWNYDKDNRKPLPKKITLPAIPRFSPDAITQEVIALVTQHLPNNFGRLDQFNFAVTHSQALLLLKDFIEHRLARFGAYEDAIKTGEPFLFHSVLSLYLNNGLLLPQQVCMAVLSAYAEGKAPLNSVEGFIRQVIGWREYIRVYYEAMMPAVRHSNYFGFTYGLPECYWSGNTDLACLKDALSHVINYGYSHHIQRLMVLSNFSNLTFTNPQALNQWFWFAYVDAYEWVELPNVLGMATFADGGILASKPYVAGGNYIHKMSDCCRQCPYDVKQKTGDRACPFNYLYWHFVDRHREVFMENGRVSLMTQMYDQKDDREKEAIRQSAVQFITRLPRYNGSLGHH